MLGRLKDRIKGPSLAPEIGEINFTEEHVKISKQLARRHRLFALFWSRIKVIRIALFLAGTLWLLALPYEGLWKNTYIDEHAIQPAQVTMYYDWANVHAADRHLATLESLVTAPKEIRQQYLVEAFLDAGVDAGNTSTAVYAHVSPPRSAGTEVILLTANWESREGGPNLRGIAILLSLAEFLRGQTHWAFDIILVVGEGYLEGLAGFMEDYYDLFPGLIWNALNIDYPGHSFEHVGLFYEGVNGRLPNQDVINSVAHIARWAGGIHSVRLHDIPDTPTQSVWLLPLGNYLLAAKHLLHHASFMIRGSPSAAHGVLARHRIDAVTVFCPNATGPHGFHTLGKTIESTLRSYNNLLERLHASYFFYLLPRPDKFIPVGNYLPAAVLLGASITLGGFDCPDPLRGGLGVSFLFLPLVVGYFVLPELPAIGWLFALVSAVQVDTKSVNALLHLLYGALVPTLAMVNFPQAIVLAYSAILFLDTSTRLGVLLFALQIVPFGLISNGLAGQWKTIGNLTWGGLNFVWAPLPLFGFLAFKHRNDA